MSKYIIKKDKDHIKTIKNIFVVICFISNITQLPFFHGVMAIKFAIFLIWLFLLGYILLNFQKCINFKAMGVLCCLSAFDIFIFITQMFTKNNYTGSFAFYAIHLSVFIFIVSYLVGQICDDDIIYPIARSYIISALIVTVYVYFNFYFERNTLDNMTYAYGSKNSISFIVLIAGIQALLPNTIKNNLVKLFIIVFMLYAIFILRSRATILCMFIVIMFAILYFMKSTKKKIALVSLLVVVGLTIFFNDSLYDIFVTKIFLNNISDQNLNRISSNRMDQWIQFGSIFWKSPIIGTGRISLEAFPISILANFGVIGAIPIFLIALYPVYVYIRNFKDDNHKIIKNMVIALAVIMLFNGFFEEQSPIGPGIKCFMLWMNCGLYMGMLHSKDKSVDSAKKKSRYII